MSESARSPRVERVPAEAAGARADAWLSDALGLSRTRVQKLIQSGDITVTAGGADPRAPKKSEAVEEGWVFTVKIPAPEATALVAQDLPLDIVFEDEHLAVVNKAAGMVVHPAPGHPDGTLVNALMHHLNGLSDVGGRMRPGIVHRLDRDTSGLLVVAKTDAAHVGLADALRRRHVKRLYRTVTWGRLAEPEMKVDAPMARDPRDRKRMGVVEGGRRAITRIRVREDWPAAQLLDVALQTGRTHQIRVHTAAMRHPCVGDLTYGADPVLASRLGLSRQWLHAVALAFDHPSSGERVRFTSDYPTDLADALDRLRTA